MVEAVKPFFVVLRSDDLCLKRHDEPMEAEEEAERLVIKEGKRFYVLAVVDVLEPVKEVARVPLEFSSFKDQATEMLTRMSLKEVDQFIKAGRIKWGDPNFIMNQTPIR